MKLETIKTYTLIILVGISFIFTFSLWNYQPKGEHLASDFVSEADFNLGGTERSKKELIAPSSIIFEKYNHFYSFSDPSEKNALYEDIQSWNLFDYRETEADGRPNDNHQVEIIYPLELPMNIVPSLFTVNDGVDEMPSWSFQRVFITYENNRNLTLQFLSIDGRQQVKFTVNNTAKHELIWDYNLNLEGLDEYIEFDGSDNPIYIPQDEVAINEQTLIYQRVEPELMVNALFNNPKEVILNQRGNESFYQDGIRTMAVSENKRMMEYTNPQEPSPDIVTPMELVENSISHLNQYKGWINDYQLESIDTKENKLRYQMHYNNYPVFDMDDLDIIEQQWRDNELFQYKTSLISIARDSYTSELMIESGKDISAILKNSSEIDTGKVLDIRVGYEFIDTSDGNADKLTLKPAWFMNYEGSWRKINVDEITHNKGVS
ncbi:Two-component signal transduction system YycFG, regulatory protein YycH [Oceanobacillus limi]|uniref:Two-component signal transduction system YycFG, regulatory protein YycH n=1 Tax=Oceanobacillus limi TaxID=930131 RepID=A0A1I0CZX1_9BACI|nr:two-component system activity regulator YycH [Oceanobacillus limi]SET24700.1 Two-component signal transduction system YycFG, regulatory protein YycH [Oceanobacillus limi]